MTERSTLEYIADLVIQRVVTHPDDSIPLGEALERAYPFGDAPYGREVWENALRRNAIDIDATKQPNSTASFLSVDKSAKQACKG